MTTKISINGQNISFEKHIESIADVKLVRSILKIVEAELHEATKKETDANNIDVKKDKTKVPTSF